MTHHTWSDRFRFALKNKNWKKILAHQLIEYSWLGSVYIALEGDPIFWPIGISGMVIIHFIVFEAIDALHRKKIKHKWIPRWIHWFVEHEHKS